MRRQQTIAGNGEDGRPPTLLLYSPESIANVINTFASIVSNEFEGDVLAWAVAARHRGAESGKGLSLRNYCPTYRAPTARDDGGRTLHAVVRSSATGTAAGQPFGPHVATLTRGLAELLRRREVEGFDKQMHPRQFLGKIERMMDHGADRVRRVIHRCLVGQNALGCGAWADARAAIEEAFDPIFVNHPETARSKAFFEEMTEEAERGSPAGEQHLDVEIGGRTVRVNLGSIASVKGQSHDATLVLQTVSSRTKDVQKALKVAAGIDNKPTPANPKLLRAVTNIFVGSTRPRHLLCIAMPEDDVPGKLRKAVEEWGWDIVSCPVAERA